MNKAIEFPDVRFVLNAVVTWCISALLLVVIASLIATLSGISLNAVAYISSALSFISALVAGMRAMRERGKGAIITGAVVGVTITILALTLGFIIDAAKIQADGILSVVTFTIAGAVTGSVFCPQKKRKKGRGRRLS